MHRAMRSGAILFGLILITNGCAKKPTYASGCGPLPNGWMTPKQGRGIFSIVGALSVMPDGSLTWNGVKVSEAVAKDYLRQVGEMDPVPVTRIRFSPATDCSTVERLRQMIAESLACKNGRCIEGEGRTWIIGDVGPDPKPFDQGNSSDFKDRR